MKQQTDKLTVSDALKLKRPLTKKELSDTNLTQHDVLEGLITTAMSEIKQSLDAHMALAYGKEEEKLSGLVRGESEKLSEIDSINATKRIVDEWTHHIGTTVSEFPKSTMKNKHRVVGEICKEFARSSSTLLMLKDNIEMLAWGTLLITFIRNFHECSLVDTKTADRWNVLASFKEVTNQFIESFGDVNEEIN